MEQSKPSFTITTWVREYLSVGDRIDIIKRNYQDLYEQGLRENAKCKHKDQLSIKKALITHIYKILSNEQKAGFPMYPKWRKLYNELVTQRNKEKDAYKANELSRSETESILSDIDDTRSVYSVTPSEQDNDSNSNKSDSDADSEEDTEETIKEILLQSATLILVNNKQLMKETTEMIEEIMEELIEDDCKIDKVYINAIMSVHTLFINKNAKLTKIYKETAINNITLAIDKLYIKDDE